MAVVLDRPATCLTARLHHLGMQTPRGAELADFYRSALGYRFEAVDDRFVGRAHDRRLVLAPGPAKGLAFIGYAVTVEELGRLGARIAGAGHDHRPVETDLFSPALEVRDPDGNLLVFGVPREPADADEGSALEARIQHTVVASRNPDRISRFFQDALGFTLSDVVVDEADDVRAAFLRCSHEHHSFAVFKATEDRLDHHCYEVPDWNAIRDWGDHLAAQHIPIKWGPGRHGPGNNLFLFVHDPDGNWVELSAEIEVVSYDRPVGVWPHEQRTLNSWGQGLLRS